MGEAFNKLPYEKKHKVHSKIQKAVNQGRKSKIDIIKAYDLHKKGMTYVDIGKIFGTTGANVQSMLDRYGLLYDENEVEHYRKNKANIIAEMERKVLRQFTDNKISEMKGSEMTYSLKGLNEIQRLEQGKSTQNVAIEAMIDQKIAIDKEIEELSKKLGLPVEEIKKDMEEGEIVG